MKNVALLVLIAGCALIGGCVSTAMSGTACNTDTDCSNGQLCVNGSCFSSRNGDQTPCTSDPECGSGKICAATGFCEAATGGQTCSVTTDCPEDQYCNFNLSDRVCAPLASGACRNQTQCGSGLVCSAATGGVGRCVQCLSGSDCSSGVCNSDGTCAGGGSDAGATDNATSDRDAGVADSVRPDAGNCSPACNTGAGEYCVVDVCYGSNGCPLHAHPVGANGQCSCDTGWVPNTAGTACVMGGSDAGSTDSSGVDRDAAYDAGSTDSSVGGNCVPACNTAAGEFCYESVCYNADGCPRNAHAGVSANGEDPNYCYCNSGYVPNPTGDGCVVGSASDAGTGQDSGGSDPCATYGYYGDGYCDDFCPQPDPDCADGGSGSDGGSGGCPPNAHVGVAANGEDPTYCYCDYGYVVNATGDGCEPDGGGGGGGGLGESCGSDGDCGFSSDAFCAVGWPGGYCTSSCYSSDDCGYAGECNCMDGECYEAYCFALCGSNADCRSGYYCDFWSWQSASGGGFCVPN